MGVVARFPQQKPDIALELKYLVTHFEFLLERNGSLYFRDVANEPALTTLMKQALDEMALSGDILRIVDIKAQQPGGVEVRLDDLRFVLYTQ